MRFRPLAGLTLIALLALFSTGLVANADVVTVVSSKSPITALDKSQIADIFLGRANHFPDGSQALPVDLLEGAAVRDRFYGQIVGKSPPQLKAHWSKIIFTGRGQPPKTVANSAQLKKLLSVNISAIGYIDAAEVDPSVRVLNAP